MNINDEKYSILENPIDVFITKTFDSESGYEISASFDENDANVTNKLVKLIDGRSVTIEASITDDNIVEVKIPNNKYLEGSYKLKLVKEGEDKVPLPGVKFKVNGSDTDATNSSGITYVKVNGSEDIQITEDNLNEFDIYQITEIQVSDNSYVELNESIPVKIKKKLENGRYKVDKVSFANGKTYKDVKLKNGSTVRVLAKITDDGTVVEITIPNKKIGKYSLYVEKVDKNKNALSGVGFKCNNENFYTNEDGKAEIVADCEINRENVNEKDEYEITEVPVKEGGSYIGVNDVYYVVLKDPIKVYVKKAFEGNNYIVKSVSFNASNENENTKEVELKNGETVTLEARIENNDVIITVPNEKLQYKVKIKKVDERGNALKDAYIKYNNEERKSTSENGEVEFTSYVDQIDEENTIYIKEELSPSGYKNIFEDVAIRIDYKLNEDGEIEITEYSNISNTRLSRNYLLVYKNDYSYVRNTDIKNFGLYYQKIDVSVDEDSTIPTINVKMVNPPIDGKYDIELLKQDEEGNALPGVKFEVTEAELDQNENETNTSSAVTKITDESGKAEIKKNKIIDSSNKDKIDVYTITEISNDGLITVNGKKYSSLKDPLKVYVKKEQSGEEYIATDVSFDKNFITSYKNNNAEISLDVELQNGDQANAYAKIEENNVKLTLENKEAKKYKIKIQKHDMSGNAISNSRLYISKVNHPQVTDSTGTIETTQIIERLDSDEYTIYCTEYYTPGYENLFKNVYIKIKYKIDENGKIDLIQQRYTTTESERDYVLVERDDYTTQITSEDDEYNYYFTNNIMVDVNNDIDVPEIILTLKNPKIDNSYGIQILKQDDEGNGIKGVSFKVKEGTDEKTITTGDDGKVLIEDNKEMSSVDTDTYEITEIDVGNNEIIKLNDNEVITVSVEKEYKDSKYNVKKVYVNGQEECNVTLANGETETVKAEIIDERLVQITIPNKRIEGAYSLKLKKIDSKTNAPISGVKFKIKNIEVRRN